MDDTTPSISPADLFARLGTASSPYVFDARRDAVFHQDDVLIAGALRASPPPETKPVVVYCVHGHEVSQGEAARLRSRGIDAVYLAGGITAWKNLGLPLRRKLGTEGGGTTWITRERPKIDRIACPWLISRFIDPHAIFVYTAKDRVVPEAKRIGAIPYDIEGVEFTHEGERCSFDTIVRIYGIADDSLDRLARIVRGADTSRHDLEPQCAGLFAISLGLSANWQDDHAMLAHGMVIYDALYSWCRSLRHETHNWPAAAGARPQ